MTQRQPPKGDQQLDLFVAVLCDLPLRDQRECMERPFLSLSKNRRMTPISYTSPDGTIWLQVDPHQSFGMATIWDWDIMIWAASQIREQIEHGRQPSRHILCQPYNLLKAIRRGTSGRDYEELKAALNRLAGTVVQTNIRAKGKKKIATFHWLDSWTEVIDEQSGQSQGITITLSQWIWEGVLMDSGVLSVAPEYFLLTGGLERWLYRVARKHGGMQDHGWGLSMPSLHEKSGSPMRLADFAKYVRKIVEADSLPEYHLSTFRNEAGDEMVWFIRRSKLPGTHPAFDFPNRRRLKRLLPATPTA